MNNNILILSCGTRNKLIRYFKENGNGIGKVVGTDLSAHAPALYETDSHYLVPPMTSPDYLDIILGICRKEQIDAVLPLQEDELYLVASHRNLFLKESILPIVSGADTIELCRDKYAFFKHLQRHGLPVLPTFGCFQEFQISYNAGEIDFPVFVKPIRGCGSIGVQKVGHIELLSALCKYADEQMLIQKFSQGEEYGIDIYVDMLSHEPVSIFAKKKLRMRAGETDKSVSVKDESLFTLVRQTVSSLSLSGPVDMDVFCTQGEYFISEVNPRFGGGYPHAHSCGINFPKLIAENINGRSNTDAVGEYEENIYMLKYTDLITLKL